ncbi:hypothetical protein [Granulicella tundricola]|nr:hypothetical protein [Granulicella tundricola]
MKKLLEQLEIDPGEKLKEVIGQAPEIILIDGCVFLADVCANCKAIRLEQFPDRTGYECLINHTHHRVGRGKKALTRVFEYIAGIRRSLRSLGGENFMIIIAVAKGEATVRFHQSRPGEVWLTDDLELYKHEAIMTIPA